MVPALEDSSSFAKWIITSTSRNVARPHKVSSALKSDGLFAKITQEVNKKPALAKSVNAVFAYNITENGKVVKQWTLDLKTPEVYEGAPKTKADTTMTVSDSDLVDVASGTLSPQVALMEDKLKITGNIMLTQKLQPLLKAESKL